MASTYPSASARFAARRAAWLQRRSLRPGEILCRQGAPAGPTYLVLNGTLRVRTEAEPAWSGGRGPGQELAALGRGSLVGELSPLIGGYRRATVQADSETEVLIMPLETLRHLATEHRALARVLTFNLVERAGLGAADVARLAERHGLPPADPAWIAEAQAARSEVVPTCAHCGGPCSPAAA